MDRIELSKEIIKRMEEIDINIPEEKKNNMAWIFAGMLLNEDKDVNDLRQFIIAYINEYNKRKNRKPDSINSRAWEMYYNSNMSITAIAKSLNQSYSRIKNAVNDRRKSKFV